METLSVRISSVSWPVDRIAVLLVLFAVTGCGGVKPIPVSGNVTLDGKPVDSCGVVFIPVTEGPHAIQELACGQTDMHGQFTLSTRKISGAMPGEYRVTVTKQETTGMIGSVPGPNGVRTKWNRAAEVQRSRNVGPPKNG